MKLNMWQTCIIIFTVILFQKNNLTSYTRHIPHFEAIKKPNYQISIHHNIHAIHELPS